MKPPRTPTFTDHFLQAEIIKRLMAAETPLRFSELKEDGVENSLFMYHANKLLRRGMIEKRDGGFGLTRKGAAWANLVGTDAAGPKLLPRPLVQLIVRSGDELLLARRKGSMKTLLNEFSLPGRVHTFGFTAQEVAEAWVKEYFGVGVTPRFTAQVEHIFLGGDLPFHTVSQVFELKTNVKELLREHGNYDYEWHPLAGISSENPDFTGQDAVLFVAKKLRTGGLAPREAVKSS
jgi:hypothetical protein